MRLATVMVASLVVSLAGCRAPIFLPPIDLVIGIDTGAPADTATPDLPDVPGPPDAGLDAGPDAVPDAPPVDLVVPPGTTVAAPPAEVVSAGTGGFLLRGTVLTPTGALSPGEVLVVGNTIACVAADCSSDPGAASVTVIDTHATISPGLIDGHNHLTYNFLKEWVPSPARQFVSRYEWRDADDYKVHVDPEGDSNNDGAQDNDAQCPGGKWGELRSIIHGTTMVQGQSPSSGCLDRLARNADHHHGLGPDLMRTSISGACEGSATSMNAGGLNDPARVSLVNDFTDGSATRFMIHMGEGYALHGTSAQENPTEEFDCYAGRSRFTTSLLYGAGDVPYGTAVFIHAIPLTPAQLDEAVTAQVRFVWSPSSNLVLYGRTADIAGMLARNLVVGLGPDWTPSGSDEMLSEMRVAEAYGRTAAIPALTAQRIWQMATYDGADAMGHAAQVGRLAVGFRADLAVFGRIGDDPYRAVLESRAADVRLVMIDGAAYYGDQALEATTAVNGDCEALDACGTAKFLCAANTPGNDSGAAETVADLRAQLTGILGSYGRPGDLLELVDCSL